MCLCYSAVSTVNVDVSTFSTVGFFVAVVFYSKFVCFVCLFIQHRFREREEAKENINAKRRAQTAEKKAEELRQKMDARIAARKKDERIARLEAECARLSASPSRAPSTSPTPTPAPVRRPTVSASTCPIADPGATMASVSNPSPTRPTNPTNSSPVPIAPPSLDLKMADFGLSSQDITPLSGLDQIESIFRSNDIGGILIVKLGSNSSKIVCVGFGDNDTNNGSVVQVVCVCLFYFLLFLFVFARMLVVFLFLFGLQSEIENNEEKEDDSDDNWNPGAILQEMIELNEEETDLIKDLRTKGNVDSNVMKDHFILTNNTYTNRLNDVVKSKGHVAWLSDAKMVDLVKIEDWNLSEDQLLLKLKNIVANNQWLGTFEAKRMKIKLGIE